MMNLKDLIQKVLLYIDIIFDFVNPTEIFIYQLMEYHQDLNGSTKKSSFYVFLEK